MPENSRNYRPDQVGNHNKPQPLVPNKYKGPVKHSGMTGLHDFNPHPLPPKARKRGPGER